MELKVIQNLDFDFLAPTTEEFFSINSDFFEFTEQQRFFGEYFFDASLLDYGLLKYIQSTIADTCGYIVMKFFNLNGVDLIVDNTNPGVKHKDIKYCTRQLCLLMKYLSKFTLGATKNNK